MAGLIGALARSHHVEVATWRTGESSDPVQTHAMVPGPARRLSGFASLKPRLVRQLFGAHARRQLTELVEDYSYDAVMYSHSYMAAALPVPDLRTIIDLANVESQRYRRFAESRRGTARLSATLEYVKARRWEPRTIHAADLVTVLSEADFTWAQHHNVSTVLVPNGMSRPTQYNSSPASGPALFLASMDYEPNRSAASMLMNDVWPQVRSVAPEARLLIAGRSSAHYLSSRPREGIEILGTVSDLQRLYRCSALVIAPVQTGAGRQLKVVEALANQRTVVCSPYSAESVPRRLDP